jgi:hypothetical protein
MAVRPSLHLFGQRLSPFTYFDAIALIHRWAQVVISSDLSQTPAFNTNAVDALSKIVTEIDR